MSPDGLSPDAPRAAGDNRRMLSTTSPVTGPEMHEILDARRRARRSASSELEPGHAALVELPAGSFLRVMVLHQPQVGEIRLWDRTDLNCGFSRAVTRARCGAHLSVGDQLVTADASPSVLATVSGDSVQWFGYDNDGAGVHDLLGSPCDHRASGLVDEFDAGLTCRGSVAESLAAATGSSAADVATYVGEGVGVFVCSGMDRDTGRYFSRPTPARGGDYMELYAHQDLLAAVSACPVGDGTQPGDTSGPGRLQIDIISPES